MHLTNSSLNKKSSDYVRCDDPEVEDYGSKWSMSAVLRYLKQEGKDTTLLMRKVEDLIIKAVLSARLQIANTCKKSVPHRTNCFELYGFDVLIDSKLKPWLIEVNLSPSLTCDAPLDLKIKANMIADMFSLVGFVCQDPLSSHPRSGRVTLKHPAVQKVQGPALASNSETEGSKDKPGPKQCQKDSTPSLTAEEIEVLHRTKEENERRGGFIRIFPTTETWALYGKYLDSMTSLNNMLANTLFQERNVNGNVQLQVDGCHAVQYERKLRPLEERKRTQRHLTHRSAAGRKKSGKQSKASPSVSSSQEGEEGEEVKQVLEPGSHKALVAEQRKQVATPLERCHGEALSSSEAAAHSARPTVNLLHILQQGWDLSKVQARVAFSSYLQRVQQRLLAESRAYTIPACPEKDNDQMELVIRFLKRAASNFQQDIKVVLPSRQLPFQDRRRILSHQLGELIHCYNKETDRMVKKQEDSKEDHFVNPSVFQEYISTASESDLEEVLTFYMQKTLPVAQEDSSASESSLFTGEVSSDPDIEVSENQPTVCALPEEQAAVRSSKTQPEVQASQHCSSSPLTLDCTHIYHQHCPPNTTSLPLHCPPPPPPLSPQPPSYTQSLARSQFCHAEGLSEPPAYASTVMVTQPPRAEWTEVSSGSHTLSTGHPTQSFTSSTPSSGAASFLLRPTPECQVIKKKKGSSIELTSLNKASRMLGEESFTPNPEVLHTAATTHQPVKAVNSGKDHCDTISHRPGKHNNGLWESQMQSAYSFMTGANRQQCHQQSQGSYQLQFAILKLQQQRLQSQQYVDQSHCRHQAPFPYQIPHFQASTNSSNCPTPGFHVQPGHSHGHSHIQTCVSPIYTPKPPSSAREEQTRKIATKRLIKQISTESSASGGVSSGQHMVYDAICSKTSLAMYQKLFQTKHPGNR
ncbi:tubulin polyglutamylase TTLL5 isoform X4 [Xyrichtys novacula]|nr:tubulin polyglutamylase TTLL5 isoform X4 [Xyrichtys novacula]